MKKRYRISPDRLGHLYERGISSDPVTDTAGGLSSMPTGMTGMRMSTATVTRPVISGGMMRMQGYWNLSKSRPMKGCGCVPGAAMKLINKNSKEFEEAIVRRAGESGESDAPRPGIPGIRG